MARDAQRIGSQISVLSSVGEPSARRSVFFNRRRIVRFLSALRQPAPIQPSV